MGIYADTLAQALTFPATGRIADKLTALGAKADPSTPTTADAIDAVHTIAIDGTDHTGGTFALTVSLRIAGQLETFTTGTIGYNAASNINAVHTIAQDGTDHTGGTFAVTVTLLSGETFTTAAIVFNANAATIETAVDVAATAATITGWTNGDITVAGGILQAAGAAVTFTFDGTSVDLTNHPITTFDGALLTGGVEPGTRVTITNTTSIAQAIDSAATTAAVTSWANGHISVSGGILQAAGAAVVLTFDGTSVLARNHVLTVFDGALLTGGVEPATRMVKTTSGQSVRNGWGSLISLGVITSTIPDQDAIASTDGVTVGTSTNRYEDSFLRALAREAAAEDHNNGAYHSIANILFPNDRAPEAEHTGNNTDLS